MGELDVRCDIYNKNKIKFNGNTFDVKNKTFNDVELDPENEFFVYDEWFINDFFPKDEKRLALEDPKLCIYYSNPEFNLYLNEREKLPLKKDPTNPNRKNIQLDFTSLFELKQVDGHLFKKNDFLCNKLEALYTTSYNDTNDILDRKQHVCFYLEDINEGEYLNNLKKKDTENKEEERRQINNQIQLVKALKKITNKNMKYLKLKYDERKHCLYSLDKNFLREIKLFFDNANNLTKVEQISAINIGSSLNNTNTDYKDLNYIIVNNKILVSNNKDIVILDKKTKKVDEVKHINTGCFQYYLDITKISKTDDKKKLKLEEVSFPVSFPFFSSDNIETKKDDFFKKKVKIIKKINNQEVELPLREKENYCNIY